MLHFSENRGGSDQNAKNVTLFLNEGFPKTSFYNLYVDNERDFKFYNRTYLNFSLMSDENVPIFVIPTNPPGDLHFTPH